MTTNYRVWSHDVWGNEKDGFEVNDNRLEAEVEIHDMATNREIMQALKHAGLLIKACQERWLEFDGDDATIYINQARNGYPLYTLTNL